MENIIRDEIVRFVRESPETRLSNKYKPYFEDTLIGFAYGDDLLFNEFKKIIGDFHLTPTEIIENRYGVGIGETKSVICRLLPISEPIRASNRVLGCPGRYPATLKDVADSY